MKKKSLVSLLLAVVLVFALMGSALAADFPENTFDDVKRSDWFAPAVDFAQASELMNGVGGNRFDPTGSVTRAMVATVLYRMAETPSVAGMTNPFSDVSNDDSNWYRDAVIWAADAGVVKGMGNGKFAPTTPITREQMATMIMRFSFSVSGESSDPIAQMEALDPSGLIVTELLANGVDPKELGMEEYATQFNGFKDASSISSYARWNVLFCAIMGIMKGDTNGSFRPADTLTRAECAQTFLNLYNIGEEYA